MDVQPLAVTGATPMSLLSQGAAPRQRPTQIAISPSSLLRMSCS